MARLVPLDRDGAHTKKTFYAKMFGVDARFRGYDRAQGPRIVSLCTCGERPPDPFKVFERDGGRIKGGKSAVHGNPKRLFGGHSAFSCSWHRSAL